MRFAVLVLVVLTLIGMGEPSFAQSPWGRTDTQKELELGQQIYEEMVSTHYVSQNETYIRRVQRVIAQLVSALPEKLYPFHPVVLADSIVNAECSPGGYIMVYEGLLDVMHDDNQLASVLAHEIGHAVRRHWARRTRKMQSDRARAILVAILTRREVNEEGLAIAAIAHTREHEREADEFGTELYLRAGFPPDQASSAMKAILSEEKGPAPPAYLRTHPATADRVRDIDSTVERLLKGGLKPVDPGATPNLSIESVFGKVPTLASASCEWQPLEPGTIWSYEIRSSGARSGYSVEAVGLTQVGGTSIARMKMNVGGRAVFYQLIGDEDRIWRRNRPEDVRSEWAVETVFPDADGVLDAGKWSFKNLGTETIETPAGKFEDCTKIGAVEASGRTLTLWFAKHVGLVRRLNEKAGVDEVLVSIKRP